MVLIKTHLGVSSTLLERESENCVEHYEGVAAEVAGRPEDLSAGVSFTLVRLFFSLCDLRLVVNKRMLLSCISCEREHDSAHQEELELKDLPQSLQLRKHLSSSADYLRAISCLRCAYRLDRNFYVRFR